MNSKDDVLVDVERLLNKTGAFDVVFFFFFNDTATPEIYTRSIVGSVRCV
ncbi:hypothetical protein AMBR_DPAELIID_02782 [Lacticaseibacillus rhamnosus]|nr:hypothetical protein AMBR_DPAELIID_02782 [Lacticaseibacillus rhamnosus]